MSSGCEEGVVRSQPAVHRSDQTDAPLIALRLSVDEGRWLLTAIGIAVRLLEGLRLRGRDVQRFQEHGLAVLQRIASDLPSDLSAYYPSSSDLDDVGE